MADWEEIKRLAADFQRTQESDTLQRISERNCIDIVKKLTDLNLIDLVYTCDGKEFITPNHLLKEIEDEVHVNGGRVHFHDLAASLNVDYQHVENISKQIVSDRPDEYNLILGQIIHSTYKTTLEKQIYDTMIATGQLSIADFAKTLDLPTEFLSIVVKELLPRVMEDYVVSPDERTYYTTDLMDRYKSIIAGTLTAITKPTNIASIMKKLDIPERLFAPIVDGLIKDGRVDANLENRIYIPAVYAREQSEWVDKFYTSNSYVEYDMLSRMDIKQPKAFLKKRFPEGLQLKTCFVGQALMIQVESMIEDCIATNGLIDISSIIPPSIQAEDIDQMLHDIFKKNKQFSSSCVIINQTNVCSLGYIATCKKSLVNLMESKAQEHLKEGRLVNFFLGGQLKGKNQADSNIQNKVNTTKVEIEAESNTIVQDAAVCDSDVITEENRPPNNKDQAESKPKVDSDDEQTNKKSKGSRRSGGGAQGREIKQKSVKKKYMVGKGRGRINDDSEDEIPASKAPKSNKGRAARRAASPETLQSSTKATKQNNKKGSATTAEKEPLRFMESNELEKQLKQTLGDAGDFSDGLFKSLANMLETDLNKAYVSVAHKVLDDYVNSIAGDNEDETCEAEKEGDIDLIE